VNAPAVHPWLQPPSRAALSISRTAWTRALYPQHKGRLLASAGSAELTRDDLRAINRSAWAGAYEEAGSRCLEGMPA